MSDISNIISIGLSCWFNSSYIKLYDFASVMACAYARPRILLYLAVVATTSLFWEIRASRLYADNFGLMLLSISPTARRRHLVLFRYLFRHCIEVQLTSKLNNLNNNECHWKLCLFFLHIYFKYSYFPFIIEKYQWYFNSY